MHYFNDLHQTTRDILFFFLALISTLCLAFLSVQFLLILCFLGIYGYLIIVTFNSQRFFYLMIIAIITAEILSLRYTYFVWGDPWFEYFSVKSILSFHTLQQGYYWAQQPTMHLSIATASLFSNIDPFLIQKFGVPLFSVIGIVAYYFIGKLFFDRKIVFLSCLFLIVSTVYLHWVTQAVRESMGLAILLLTLYVSFQALFKRSYSYLLTSLILILGLVLLHHLSSAFFLIIWCTVSLSFIYGICDEKAVRQTTIISLIITLFSFLTLVLWWYLRLPEQYNYLENLIARIGPVPLGMGAIIFIIITIHLLPIYDKNHINLFKNGLEILFSKKKIIFSITAIISLIGAIIAIFFVMGKSYFILNYPWTMFLPSFIIFGFFMIGLYFNLELQKLPILSWILIISLILVLSMLRVVNFPDPMRIFEFLAPPLIFIAAKGFYYITEKDFISKNTGIFVAVFMIVSLITSFPSNVMLGNNFYPGHPMYDQRNWIISHPEHEITSIKWLNSSISNCGIIESDVYTGYVIRSFFVRYDVLLQNYWRFPQSSNEFSSTSYGQYYYAIIPVRMYNYAEFGSEWMTKEKIPYNLTDERNLDSNRAVIYSNGGSKIYLYKDLLKIDC